ncbi:MAG: lysozyme inhibitor LprI family protein [Acidobacteriaceae bacterium]
MKLLLAFTMFFVSSSAFAVSFDCAKASTFVEKTICSDPLLRRLDDALSSNYKAMLGADLGAPAGSLRIEQRKWIANRNACTTRECLVAMYRKRIDETCDYGVVSGVHPSCVEADDVEGSQISGPNAIQDNSANVEAASVSGTVPTSAPKTPVVAATEAAAPGEVNVPNAADPAKFDIQGFHLYMTGKEVIDLMKAKYNLKPTYDDSCMSDKPQPCLKIGLGNVEASPFYPDSNELLSFVTVMQSTFALRVSFTPVYPTDPKRPEVVTKIQYYPLLLQTKADIAAFRQQVIAKYGVPRTPGRPDDFGHPYVWCRRYIDTPSQFGCEENLPSMYLDDSRNFLTISDDGLYLREEKQWESEKTAVPPPL